MKKREVQIGKTYVVMVSGNLAPVTITSESRYGGWDGRNERTGRTVRIKSAQKLRDECARGADGKWRRLTMTNDG